MLCFLQRDAWWGRELELAVGRYVIFAHIREKKIHPRAASLEYDHPLHLERRRINFDQQLLKLFGRAFWHKLQNEIARPDGPFVVNGFDACEIAPQISSP